uniref:Secreted protein n=1 Tax=Trichobilharzia regenti TaxID=157069 RepID=A0AA85J686_TRIRE|nr:unnamed protein product [Trichobilharzia regenti]
MKAYPAFPNLVGWLAVWLRHLHPFQLTVVETVLPSLIGEGSNLFQTASPIDGGWCWLLLAVEVAGYSDHLRPRLLYVHLYSYLCYLPLLQFVASSRLHLSHPVCVTLEMNHPCTKSRSSRGF